VSKSFVIKGVGRGMQISKTDLRLTTRRHPFTFLLPPLNQNFA
jgi:hypothetical protein